MQIEIFRSFHPEHQGLYEEILSMTQPVADIYPEYSQWFKETFLPGLKRKERGYVIAWDEHKTMMGCALIKKTPDEQKICTVFIRPQFRKQGIGRALFSKIISEPDMNCPFISVSEKNISQFMPLLKEFGFHPSGTQIRNSSTVEHYFKRQQGYPVTRKELSVSSQCAQHIR